MAEKGNLCEYRPIPIRFKKMMREDMMRGEATAIKLEPAFLAENEEALWAAGCTCLPRSNEACYAGRGSRGGAQGGRKGWPGGSGGAVGKFDIRGAKAGQRRGNSTGPDGKPLICRACGSYRHMLADCPDSWGNLAKVNITETDQHTGASGEKVVLFTGYNKSELPQSYHS